MNIFVSEMDFHSMKRKELQALCKKNNIPANLTNLEMANKLTSLLKEKEKPMTRGRSCLKNMGEIASENDSDVAVRQSKKVRFSPENEIIEFVDMEADPVETKRVVGRKSMRRPVRKKRGQVIENVDSIELSIEIVDNPVRSTRSRAQNSVEGLVILVLSPLVGKKRPRRGVSSNVDRIDKPPPVTDLSVNLASDSADVEETKVLVRRSSRNRGEVVVENKKEGEGVSLLISRKNPAQKRNAKGSDEIFDNEGLTAEGGITPPEKGLRRSKRNVRKDVDPELLNGESGENEMVGRGRSTRSRIQSAVEASAVDSETKTETETEVEVQGESEVVLQHEESLRGPGRNGNRRKSLMPQNGIVRTDRPNEEDENRKQLRDSKNETDWRGRITQSRTQLETKASALDGETETEGEVQGDFEVVLQLEKPPRGQGRKANRRKSVMPQIENVGTDAPMAENENRKQSKSSVLAGEGVGLPVSRKNPTQSGPKKRIAKSSDEIFDNEGLMAEGGITQPEKALRRPKRNVMKDVDPELLNGELGEKEMVGRGRRTRSRTQSGVEASAADSETKTETEVEVLQLEESLQAPGRNGNRRKSLMPQIGIVQTDRPNAEDENRKLSMRSKNETDGRGRITQSRTQLETKASAVDGKTKTEGEVQGEFEFEEPSRGQGRKGNRRKSVMLQIENVGTDAPKAENVNRKQSKSSVLAGGCSVEVPKENEKVSRPNVPLRRSRRKTVMIKSSAPTNEESGTHEAVGRNKSLEQSREPFVEKEVPRLEELVRKSRENASRHESAAISDERDGIANATEKNKPRKRRSDPILEEGVVVTKCEPLIEEPPRWSIGNSAKSKTVAPAIVSGKVIGKKLQTRSKSPNLEVEVPLVESILAVEAPPTVDAQLSMPEVAETASYSVLSSSKEVPSDTATKKRKDSGRKSLAKEVCSVNSDIEEARDFIVVNSVDSHVSMLVQLQSDYTEKETEISVSESTVVTEKVNISIGVDKEKPLQDDIYRVNEDDSASQSWERRGDFDCNNFVEQEPEEVLNMANDVGFAETKPAADGCSLVYQSEYMDRPANILNLEKELETDDKPSTGEDVHPICIMADHGVEDDKASAHKDQNLVEFEEGDGFGEPIILELVAEGHLAELNESGGSKKNLENASEEGGDVNVMDPHYEKKITPTVLKNRTAVEAKKSAQAAEVQESAICRSEIQSVEVEAPLTKNMLAFEDPAIVCAGLSEPEASEHAINPVLSSRKEVYNYTNRKKRGSTRKSSLKKQHGSVEVCAKSPYLEGDRDPMVMKLEGTLASNSLKLHSYSTEQETDISINKSLVVAEKENIIVVVGNENLVQDDTHKGDDNDLAPQSQKRNGDYDSNTLVYPEFVEHLNKVSDAVPAETFSGAEGFYPVQSDFMAGDNESSVHKDQNLVEFEEVNRLAEASTHKRVIEGHLTGSDEGEGAPEYCENASKKATEFSAFDPSDEGRIISNFIGGDSEKVEYSVEAAKLQGSISVSLGVTATVVAEEDKDIEFMGTPPLKPTVPECQASCIGEVSDSTVYAFSIDNDAPQQDGNQLKGQLNVQSIMPVSNTNHAKTEENSSYETEIYDGTIFEGDTLVCNAGDEMFNQERLEEDSTEMENNPKEGPYMERALQAVDEETSSEGLEENSCMNGSVLSVLNELQGHPAKKKENAGFKRNCIHVSEEFREGSMSEFSDGERISKFVSNEKDTVRAEDTLTPIIVRESSGIVKNESMSYFERTPLKDDNESIEEDELKILFATPANNRNPNEEEETFSNETEMADENMAKGSPQEVVGTKESEHEEMAYKGNALPTEGEETSDVGSNANMYAEDELKILFATPANNRNPNEEEETFSNETEMADENMAKGSPQEVVETKESEHEEMAYKGNALPTVGEETSDVGSNANMYAESTVANDSTYNPLDGSISKDGYIAEDKGSGGSKPNCENASGERTCVNVLEVPVGAGILLVTSEKRDTEKIENFEEAVERNGFIAEPHAVGADTDSNCPEGTSPRTPSFSPEYQASGTSNKQMLSSKRTLLTDKDKQDREMNSSVDIFVHRPFNKSASVTDAKDDGKGMEDDPDVEYNNLSIEEENAVVQPVLESCDPGDCEGVAQVNGNAGASLVETTCEESEASEEKLYAELIRSPSKCIRVTNMLEEEVNEGALSAFDSAPGSSDEMSDKVAEEKLILVDSEADLDCNEREDCESYVPQGDLNVAEGKELTQVVPDDWFNDAHGLTVPSLASVEFDEDRGTIEHGTSDFNAESNMFSGWEINLFLGDENGDGIEQSYAGSSKANFVCSDSKDPGEVKENDFVMLAEKQLGKYEHQMEEKVAEVNDSNESAELQNLGKASISEPAVNVDCAAISSFSLPTNHGTVEHRALEFNAESNMFSCWEINLFLGDDNGDRVEKLYAGGALETKFASENSKDPGEVKENVTVLLAQKQLGKHEQIMEERDAELNDSHFIVSDRPICEEEFMEENDVTIREYNGRKHSEDKSGGIEKSSVSIHDVILTEIASINDSEPAASVEPSAECDFKYSELENIAKTGIEYTGSLVEGERCAEKGEAVELREAVLQPNSRTADHSPPFFDSAVGEGFAVGDDQMWQPKSEFVQRKNLTSKPEEGNNRFAKQLNSTTMKRKSARTTSLIQGTPKRLITTLDMKENAPGIKRDKMGNVTTAKSVKKRRALEDVQ